MGFRTGAFATVWGEPNRKSDTLTSVRISISRKLKDSDDYEQDFGGFVSFIGTACAKKALSLKEKQRIRLGDVDLTNRYDKEKNVTYNNPTVYSFFTDESDMFPMKQKEFSVALADPSKKPEKKPEPGEVEPEDTTEGGLPF